MSVGGNYEIGRNDKCPCGSGKKYKKCCINKEEAGNEFILTEKIYERDFLPFYNLDKHKIKTVIIFEIILPFHIPMDISRTMTTECDEGYLSFRFDMVTTNDSYKYILEEDNPNLNVHFIKIAMIAAVDLEHLFFSRDTETYYNYYFDLLLKEFNKIVVGYMIAEKDEDCHYLTKEMLQPFVVVRTTDLDTWESNGGIFIIHENVSFEKDLLKEKNIQEISRMQSIALSEFNPFVMGERYVLFAKRYFKQGFYQEALLYAQISVEVFVRQLFKEILVEVDKKGEEEINGILENTSFMSIVKSKLPHILGGNWDITKENTEVGKWYKNTYQLRNRAIHVGIIPTFSETDKAIYDAIKFREFILDRIKLNKKQYPKLNEYFM